MIAFAIIFILVGLFTTIFPDKYFAIREGWKGNSDREPSDLYLLIARVSGIALIIAGIIVIKVSLQ